MHFGRAGVGNASCDCGRYHHHFLYVSVFSLCAMCILAALLCAQPFESRMVRIHTAAGHSQATFHMPAKPSTKSSLVSRSRLKGSITAILSDSGLFIAVLDSSFGPPTNEGRTRPLPVVIRIFFCCPRPFKYSNITRPGCRNVIPFKPVTLQLPHVYLDLDHDHEHDRPVCNIYSHYMTFFMTLSLGPYPCTYCPLRCANALQCYGPTGCVFMRLPKLYSIA